MGAFDPKKQFRLILASAVLAVATLAGYSRAFYREQADADVYNIVDAAASDPRWPLAGYTIAVDPQSRMYGPNNPDSPPMPPDDAVSHEISLTTYLRGHQIHPGFMRHPFHDRTACKTLHRRDSTSHEAISCSGFRG